MFSAAEPLAISCGKKIPKSLLEMAIANAQLKKHEKKSNLKYLPLDIIPFVNRQGY